MQQSAANQPSPTSPSFAGLLAALAAPASKGPAGWNDDGLEDDVATLSYERALRAHARYRPNGPIDQAFFESYDSGAVQAQEPDPAAQAANPSPSARPSAEPQREAVRRPSAFLERDLKCASITIRLSQAECDQLRHRAAEAGLTVSAYLRSCTFEAESLRALVKETMARLRTATHAETPIPAARSRFGWLARLLPPWHGSRHAAHA